MANSDPNSALLNKTFKVLVSLFVSATAGSSNARIASFRLSHTRNGSKKSEQEKAARCGVRERGGRNPPLSLFPSFPLHFSRFFCFFPPLSISRHSPLSEHSRQASAESDAAIYKEKLMLRYTTNTKLQRFQNELKPFKALEKITRSKRLRGHGRLSVKGR